VLQARFQQKQLQEKEQKLLQMLEDQQQRTIQRVSGRGSAGSNTSSGSGSSNNSSGKFIKKRNTNITEDIYALRDQSKDNFNSKLNKYTKGVFENS